MKGLVGASMEQRDRAVPRPPAPTKATPPIIDSAETVLKLAIDIYGPALIDQPDKLARHLEEQCPAAASDSALLLAALAEGVPQALMRVSSGQELRRLVPQLEQSLVGRQGLNPFGATWAVATWATVLRMDSEGLARSLDAMSPEAVLAQGDNDTGTHAPVAAGVEPPDPASAGGEPVVVEPVSAALHPEAVSARMADDPSAFDVATSFPIPTVVEATPVTEPPRDLGPPPPIEAPTVMNALPESEPSPPVEPPRIEPPVSAEPPTFLPSRAPIDPVGIVADAEATTAASPDTAPNAPTPAWAAPRQPAAATATRFHPWFGVAGVVVAVIVLTFMVRFFATQESSDPPLPSAGSRDVAAAGPVTTSEATEPAATTSPAAPAVAPPTTGIDDVTSDEPLVGDGGQHDVFVAIHPQRDDVRWIVVQFIGGDGAWEPRPRVIDVTAEALRSGRVPVGTIGLRTTKTASVTFQYALTTADGRQSPPFVKQFAFTPVAARPPEIVGVIAPGRLSVGKPFAVTVDYRNGDAKLAAIERKVVDPGAGTVGTASVTSVDGLASPRPGRLLYPFAAVDSASRNTMELTLIDRDGLRSEPRRVFLDIATPRTATAATTESPRAAVACTRETCGSVVSVRDTDAAGAAPPRTKNYEVIVRMDDRSIRTFTVQGTWKVGRPVRVIGARLVGMNDAGRASPAKPRALPPGRLVPESAPIIDQ